MEAIRLRSLSSRRRALMSCMKAWKLQPSSVSTAEIVISIGKVCPSLWRPSISTRSSIPVVSPVVRNFCRPARYGSRNGSGMIVSSILRPIASSAAQPKVVVAFGFHAWMIPSAFVITKASWAWSMIEASRARDSSARTRPVTSNTQTGKLHSPSWKTGATSHSTTSVVPSRRSAVHSSCHWPKSGAGSPATTARSAPRNSGRRSSGSKVSASSRPSTSSRLQPNSSCASSLISVMRPSASISMKPSRTVLTTVESLRSASRLAAADARRRAAASPTKIALGTSRANRAR
jgi:hypothetical protein